MQRQSDANKTNQDELPDANDMVVENFFYITSDPHKIKAALVNSEMLQLGNGTYATRKENLDQAENPNNSEKNIFDENGRLINRDFLTDVGKQRFDEVADNKSRYGLPNDLTDREVLVFIAITEQAKNSAIDYYQDKINENTKSINQLTQTIEDQRKNIAAMQADTATVGLPHIQMQIKQAEDLIKRAQEGEEILNNRNILLQKKITQIRKSTGSILPQISSLIGKENMRLASPKSGEYQISNNFEISSFADEVKRLNADNYPNQIKRINIAKKKTPFLSTYEAELKKISQMRQAYLQKTISNMSSINYSTKIVEMANALLADEVGYRPTQLSVENAAQIAMTELGELYGEKRGISYQELKSLYQQLYTTHNEYRKANPNEESLPAPNVFLAEVNTTKRPINFIVESFANILKDDNNKITFSPPRVFANIYRAAASPLRVLVDMSDSAIAGYKIKTTGIASFINRGLNFPAEIAEKAGSLTKQDKASYQSKDIEQSKASQPEQVAVAVAAPAPRRNSAEHSENATKAIFTGINADATTAHPPQPATPTATSTNTASAAVSEQAEHHEMGYLELLDEYDAVDKAYNAVEKLWQEERMANVEADKKVRDPQTNHTELTETEEKIKNLYTRGLELKKNLATLGEKILSHPDGSDIPKERRGALYIDTKNRREKFQEKQNNRIASPVDSPRPLR